MEDSTETPNEVTTSSSESKPKEFAIKQEGITVAKQRTVQEPTYKIQDFIDNSKALGYRKEVVTGALFNCEKTELTKTEFETIIKIFLGKKVE